MFFLVMLIPNKMWQPVISGRICTIRPDVFPRRLMSLSKFVVCDYVSQMRYSCSEQIHLKRPSLYDNI